MTRPVRRQRARMHSPMPQPSGLPEPQGCPDNQFNVFRFGRRLSRQSPIFGLIFSPTTQVLGPLVNRLRARPSEPAALDSRRPESRESAAPPTGSAHFCPKRIVRLFLRRILAASRRASSNGDKCQEQSHAAHMAKIMYTPYGQCLHKSTFF